MTARLPRNSDDVPGVWMWFDESFRALFGDGAAVRVLSAIASEPGGLTTEAIAVAADVDEDRIGDLVAPLVELDIVHSWTDADGRRCYTIAPDDEVMQALRQLDAVVEDCLRAARSAEP